MGRGDPLWVNRDPDGDRFMFWSTRRSTIWPVVSGSRWRARRYRITWVLCHARAIHFCSLSMTPSTKSSAESIHPFD